MMQDPHGRAVIGVTMGDPAGVGPEVVLKAIASDAIASDVEIKLIGDSKLLSKVASELGLGSILEKIKIIDLSNVPSQFEIGVDSAITGRASAEYVVRSVELWRRGEIDAVATAPISKRAVALGGFDFPGHTEFLAALTDTEEFAMSFFAEDLRVVLLSTHISLREAIQLVKRDRLIQLIRFTNRELGRLLGKKVNIAVAGLNPHASEGGLFGTEETDEIVPAIEHCRDSNGINVSGPYSPDTIFLRCSKGEFDIVVAHYHDQATIPVKSISFNEGVNVTLGLPFPRTSVDHGTAFEIAGKGIADESSMIAAIRLAAELVSKK